MKIQRNVGKYSMHGMVWDTSWLIKSAILGTWGHSTHQKKATAGKSFVDPGSLTANAPWKITGSQ